MRPSQSGILCSFQPTFGNIRLQRLNGCSPAYAKRTSRAARRRSPPQGEELVNGFGTAWVRTRGWARPFRLAAGERGMRSRRCRDLKLHADLICRSPQHTARIAGFIAVQHQIKAVGNAIVTDHEQARTGRREIANHATDRSAAMLIGDLR